MQITTKTDNSQNGGIERHVTDHVVSKGHAMQALVFFSYASHEHNWSATKQHLHPQSVAEISHHSVLSGDNVRHRLGLTTRTQV